MLAPLVKTFRMVKNTDASLNLALVRSFSDGVDLCVICDLELEVSGHRIAGDDKSGTEQGCPLVSVMSTPSRSAQGRTKVSLKVSFPKPR